MTATDQLSLIRRMPHPIAKAAAHGIIALLDKRPDLRREFTGQDLALLESYRSHEDEIDRLLGE